MQQGVPQSLNIGDELPASIRGYRRDAIYLNTTQNEFGPGSIALIPLDTGTEGTFLDTRTIRLCFSVTFVNRSRYIDFVSLGRSGAASFIEEIGFEVNGVPIERNMQYAATVELEKIRAGEAQDPFLMAFSNPWEPCGGAAGEMHRNFMKPCMVDASGNSWDASALAHSGHVWNSLTSKAFQYDMAVDPLQDDNNSFTANFPFLSMGVDVDSKTSLAPMASVASGIAYGGPNMTVCNFDKLAEQVQQNRRGRNDLKKILAEGANVKYLPVHHRPSAANWTSDVHFVRWTTRTATDCALNDAVGTSTTYHFSLELYMGIFGRLNRKWLPTLAIGAGRAQLRIKWARPQHAFQVSMDPCRRIPGTLRDTCANSLGKHSFFPDTYAHHGPYDRTLAIVHKTARVYPDALKNDNYNNPLERQAVLKFPCAPCSAACLGTFPSVFAWMPIDDGDIAAFTEFGWGRNVGNTAAAATPDTHAAANPSPAIPYLPPDLVGVHQARAGANQAGAGVSLMRSRMAVHAPPVCQYMCVRNPLLGRKRVFDHTQGPYADIDDGNVGEEDLCYGTFLPSSRPQSRRTHPGALPQEIPPNEMTYGISYYITDIMVKAQEVLFSDSITDSLLSAGIAGNAVMETMVLKETRVQLHRAAQQKVLIPLTGASIQDICVAWRHNEQLWGAEALHQPTLSFIDPFSSYSYEVPADKVKGVNNLTLKTVWGSDQHLGCNLSFQLGSEFMPRIPIDDIHSLSEFVQQGDQIFYGQGELGEYRRLGQFPERMDIFAEWVNNPSSGRNARSLQAPAGGFFTPFISVDLLDDQTITLNPFLSCYLNRDIDISSLVGNSLLPLLEPPVGTFHISLNLETMMGHGHKTRSGSTIVNNQLYLKMDRAYGCADSNLEMFAYARCNAKIVFERGGSMQLIS